MSRPPTVAEALDAHLDYATETGEYSRALRERIAAVLPGLRIAGRWQDCSSQGEVGQELRSAAGELLAWVAWSSDDAMLPVCAECALTKEAAAFGDAWDARAWCVERLRAAGWVLCP